VYDHAAKRMVRSGNQLLEPLIGTVNAQLTDGSVGLFGGRYDAERIQSTKAFALSRDSLTSHFTVNSLPNLPTPRVLHQAITLSTGHVLLAGGLVPANVGSNPEFAADVLLFE
jgi:hypothetical protein